MQIKRLFKLLFIKISYQYTGGTRGVTEAFESLQILNPLLFLQLLWDSYIEQTQITGEIFMANKVDEEIQSSSISALHIGSTSHILVVYLDIQTDSAPPWVTVRSVSMVVSLGEDRRWQGDPPFLQHFSLFHTPPPLPSSLDFSPRFSSHACAQCLLMSLFKKTFKNRRSLTVSTRNSCPTEADTSGVINGCHGLGLKAPGRMSPGKTHNNHIQYFHFSDP